MASVVYWCCQTNSLSSTISLRIMDNAFEVTIQRLKLIENHAIRASERISDANAQGWLGEIRNAASEVRANVEANKDFLAKPLPGLYKSGLK